MKARQFGSYGPPSRMLNKCFFICFLEVLIYYYNVNFQYRGGNIDN